MRTTINRCNDSHIHLGPSGPWLPNFDPSVTADKVIEVMQKYGVTKAVVFPNPLPGSKYPEANDYIISSVRKYPANLIGFGRIDPRYGEEVIPEIKRLAESGIEGIKLHPTVECFRPDHPSFFKVFQAMVDSNIKLIVTHSSESGFAAADLWATVANRFPQLNIILAHLNEACIPLLREFPNIYADTSTASISLIRKAYGVSSSKILFGSDYPYTNYQEELGKIITNCSDEEKERILLTNFEEVICGGIK